LAAIPKPSATIVLLRDALAGLEVLLLQRSRREGKPGPWVFPGGKVEASDVVGGDPSSLESARRAGVRETREESALEVDAGALAPLSRWITPEISPRRFDTWFFAAVLPRHQQVRVDGSEMVGHRWLAPGAALAAQQAGELRLAPPTFVTVSWLQAFSGSDEAVQALGVGDLLTFRPKICRLPEGAVMLYPGDAGYEPHDPEREGPRHRLWALPSGYRYERG